jgi:hypothetical protein
MRFRNLDEAWAFWDAYGGRTGFDVRKRYANKSRLDGQIVSNAKSVIFLVIVCVAQSINFKCSLIYRMLLSLPELLST